MAEVYWIRLPEHTDVFSEGYVGVTSKTSKERFKVHAAQARCNSSKKKYRIHNVISKYGEQLIVETLCISDEDYAYSVENKLRPEPGIGWNLAAGGSNPVKSTPPVSDKTKKEMSKRMRDAWKTPSEFLTSMRNHIQTNRAAEEACERFWNRGAMSNPLSSRCDEILVEYEKDKLIFSHEILNELGEDVSEANLLFVARIIRKFNHGWNPLEDALWLEDFRGIPAEGYHRFKSSWTRNNGSSNSYWKEADKLFELFEANYTIAQASRETGIADTCVGRMFRNYFKQGWIPQEDPRWLKYVETECQKT